jgi:hypothetical protein
MLPLVNLLRYQFARNQNLISTVFLSEKNIIYLFIYHTSFLLVPEEI